jgi:hypothetical protein
MAKVSDRVGRFGPEDYYRAQLPSGEVVFLRTSSSDGSRPFLYASRPTIERCWAEYVERHGSFTPEFSKAWLATYDGCEGSNFHTWNAMRKVAA